MAFEKDNTNIVELTDFSGGLHKDPLSEDMKDSESPDCANVYWEHKLNKIWGWTQYSYTIGGTESTKTIHAIHDFVKRNGTQYLVVVTSDDLLYDNLGVWTSIKGALAMSDARSRFITFNDLCIGTNFTDEPYKWSGAGNGALLGGGPVRAKYIATFNDRVALANCRDGGSYYPCRVYFSAVDNPESWDTVLDYWELETDDGQEITGIEQLGQNLVVFKANSIGIVSGYGIDSWNVDRKFKDGVGCVSGDTISHAFIPVNGAMIEVLIFLSQEGYMAFDGSSIYHLPIPEDKEIYKNHEYWHSLNQQRLQYSTGEWHIPQGLYFCFYTASGSSYNDIGSAYDPRCNALWPMENMTVNACTRVITDGVPNIYIGTTDGRIFYMSQTSNTIPDMDELITDGDMEDVGTASYTSVLGGTLSKSVVTFQNGLQGLECDSAGSGQGLSQDITTVVGKRYTAHCSVISTAGALGGSSFQFDAYSGTTLLDYDYVAHSATEWKQAHIEFTAISTTTTIRVTDRRGAGGHMVVDDLSCRCSDIPFRWESRWFNFSSEQDIKILRELEIFAEVQGNYDIQIEIQYDKGYGTIDSASFNLGNSSAPLYGIYLYGTITYGSTILEVIGNALGVDIDAFKSMKFKLSNDYGGQPCAIQKIHVVATPIGKRYFTA